jgi:hypothetical protein
MACLASAPVASDRPCPIACTESAAAEIAPATAFPNDRTRFACKSWANNSSRNCRTLAGSTLGPPVLLLPGFLMPPAKSMPIAEASPACDAPHSYSQEILFK